MILLSILIPSLLNRRELLERLLKILNAQKTDEIEIIFSVDTGTISTGEKRNALMDKARGEYIVYVDDDDTVSEDYVCLVTEAIKRSRPDCIGINLVHYKDGIFHGNCELSLRIKEWGNFINENPPRYERFPIHLNPVRRDIAMKARFPKSSNEEDRHYGLALQPLLKTCEIIDKPIYFYMENTQDPLKTTRR
jgi:glycosyltransferase involved in cell wall biosynthesis